MTMSKGPKEDSLEGEKPLNDRTLSGFELDAGYTSANVIPRNEFPGEYPYYMRNLFGHV
jgi:hypothetical protein